MEGYKNGFACSRGGAIVVMMHRETDDAGLCSIVACGGTSPDDEGSGEGQRGPRY